MEIRVPSLGRAFGAFASSIGPDGVFLTTFQEVAIGTAVTAALSLPDGPAIVDGTVVEQGDPAGLGFALAFDGVDDALRERLTEAAAHVDQGGGRGFDAQSTDGAAAAARVA